ncbi:uncharacterized protein [Coffea arabica]|uniref:Uncharacterized protein n=1 Tax=Coffea arabica TaxID=13443 RepID=A0A6P6T0I9_COFAR
MRFLTCLWDAIENGSNLCVQLPNNRRVFELVACFSLSYHALSRLHEVADCRIILALSDKVKVGDVEEICVDVKKSICLQCPIGRLGRMKRFSILALTDDIKGFVRLRQGFTPNMILCRRDDMFQHRVFNLLGDQRLGEFTVFFEEGHDLHAQMNSWSGLHMVDTDIEDIREALPEMQEEGLPGEWETFIPHFLPWRVDNEVAGKEIFIAFLDFLLSLSDRYSGELKLFHQSRCSMDRFVELYNARLATNGLIQPDNLKLLLGWVVKSWKHPDIDFTVSRRDLFQLARFIGTAACNMNSFLLFFDNSCDEFHFDLVEPDIYMDRIRARSRSIVIASASEELEVCSHILLGGNARIEYLLDHWHYSDEVPFTPMVLTCYRGQALDGRRIREELYHPLGYQGCDLTMAYYGNLLIDMSAISISQGMLCLFPSRDAVKRCVDVWTKSGVLQKIMCKKKVYMQETKARLTEIDTKAYQLKCKQGDGGLFLAVVREYDAYNFHGLYGSIVMYIGFPFWKEASRLSMAQGLHWRARYGVELDSALRFEVTRCATDSLGTHLMGSFPNNTFVLFADFCYGKQVNRHCLPRWLLRFMDNDSILNDSYHFLELLNTWVMNNEHRRLQDSINLQIASHPRLRYVKFWVEEEED